jgi:hypothetical protein
MKNSRCSCPRYIVIFTEEQCIAASYAVPLPGESWQHGYDGYGEIIDMDGERGVDGTLIMGSVNLLNFCLG